LDLSGGAATGRVRLLRRRTPALLDEAATAADDERLCNIFRFNAYAQVAYGQLQEALARLTVLATSN